MKEVRPPVIVVVGHVDHGKTTLLDSIRKTDVAAGEAGGITQRIGAYEITTPSQRRITFIDTPGHAVFGSLRKRGVTTADIALLVIAADSSVQPQTLESLAIIREAKIPFIVVINKIDVPNALPEKVIKDLSKQNVILEGRGGDVPYVQISAKSGQGLDTLFELITLVADMHELTYDPDASVEGFVIEVKKDKRGIIPTLIVRNGTLRVGSTVKIENQDVKVRALFNDKAVAIDRATPSMPVELLGMHEAVSAGAWVGVQPASEPQPEVVVATQTTDGTEGFADQNKKFAFIIRADSYGSLEVIRERFIEYEEIQIIDSSIGEPTESDIERAAGAQATILLFNARMKKDIRQKADSLGVTLFEFSLMYELLDDIDDLILALRAKREKEARKVGEGKIIAIFEKGQNRIAGLKVNAGKVETGLIAEIVRGKKIVGESKVKSLYQKTEPVASVKRGEECGMLLSDSIDFSKGDMVKWYLP
ncbi:MAG: GTP-binding protein [Candidatus Roizmanbacteria bacterium]|nr:GTP-binding protein [Candidatus Roizmanbacteria bacterium]